MFCTHEKNTSAIHNSKVDRSALTVLSDGALNEGEKYAGRGTKRKRNSADDDFTTGELLTILSPASSLSDQQLRLVPRRLIPRSCLPLAFIDLNASPSEIATSRLFRAHIEALEGPEERCNGQVIIATKDDGPTLYAIERANQGVYTLCKLASWVVLESFERISMTSKRSCNSHIGKEDNVSDVWWKAAAVNLDAGVQALGHQSMLQTRGVMGNRLSMKPPSRNISFESAKNQDWSENLKIDYEAPLLETHPSALQILPDSNQLASTEDLLKNVRIQYQDLLYISKTSLAYFAKGPLSRARAATVQSHASKLSVHELTEYLRSNILSRTMADTKYSETLPNLLQELPIGITSDDEEGNLMTIIGDRLRKSKKRKKVAKTGLFPGEEEYITKWYVNQEKSPDGCPDTARGERIKSSLASQKARETQLQLILILETLALETSTANKPEPLKDFERSGEIAEDRSRPKGKKPVDLSALLDILVERLCIWQSTSQDESNLVTAKSHVATSHARNEASYSLNNDQLRDFCLEVLIPFYAARLPEKCSSICQKLGGTAGSSPIRLPIVNMHGIPQVLQRSSTTVQSHSRQRPRRTLERVLTDDKTVSRRPPPSLTRSATDSALPNIKRESRDVSLSAVPFQSRIQIPKHYSQREVDLTAVSQATEARLQRKAAVELELKGAIAALKKPNPRLAVKELVESAEQRTAGANFKSRKSKNPMRNPLVQGVQVTATPKGNRRKDVFGGPSYLSMTHARELEQPEVVLSSSDPRIPSSSIKTQVRNDGDELSRSIPQPAFKHIGGPQPAVYQTPSRKWSRPANTTLIHQDNSHHEENGLNEESPELPILPSLLDSSKRSLASSRNPSYKLPSQQWDIQETPTRKRLPSGNADSLGQNLQDMPVKARPGSRGGGFPFSKLGKSNVMPHQAEAPKSIYESLGWDDNDIDELV